MSILTSRESLAGRLFNSEQTLRAGPGSIAAEKGDRRTMTPKHSEISDTATDRSADLRAALEARRRDLVRDINDRLREGRAARPSSVGDMGDLSDADMQEDLDRSLLQMRAETLARIDDAISRLDAGKYGRCFECDGEIAARRLHALPFAVRCRACEERREHGNTGARPTVERRAGLLIDLAVPAPDRM